MDYLKIVNEIKNLSWEKLNPHDLQGLMFLSYQSALEFGEALRVTLKLYPNEKVLHEMAIGELKTTNLPFGEYTQAGDHAEFLEFFLQKQNLLPTSESDLSRYGTIYRERCKKLSDEVRAMTIFSREKELPGIFEQILTAPNWSAPGLPEFRYYLEQHILLDSKEGGHGDLMKKFIVDDRVTEFYTARIEMYRAIPALFNKVK